MMAFLHVIPYSSVDKYLLLKECATSIIRVEERTLRIQAGGYSTPLVPTYQIHGVTSQKAVLLTHVTIKTAELTAQF
jgi:CxxC motif-containing protein